LISRDVIFDEEKLGLKYLDEPIVTDTIIFPLESGSSQSSVPAALFHDNTTQPDQSEPVALVVLYSDFPVSDASASSPSDTHAASSLSGHESNFESEAKHDPKSRMSKNSQSKREQKTERRYPLRDTRPSTKFKDYFAMMIEHDSEPVTF
jgi:hypothetical protein